MGMAASQARYLALTARKTNTEWEGQQINQARTALANQSANLFNRLLNMEVPNPPNQTDYTELQYSYSDGDNSSVIEEWEQIGNANPDYNYIVKHYYLADVFTGVRKQLQDPQIQLGDVLKPLEYDRATTIVSKQTDSDGITVTYKINNYDYQQNYNKITQAQVDSDSNLKNALISFETAKGYALADGNPVINAEYGYQDSDGTWHFFIANEFNRIESAEEGSQRYEALLKYETENNLLDGSGNLTFNDIFGYSTPDVDEEGNPTEHWHFVVNKNIPGENTFIQPLDYTDYSTVYGPSYVGNSKLTELNKLVVDKEKGIDQVAELAQILRDCPEDSINKYVHFDSDGSLIYEGKGIYTFDLFGKSYYTTEEDLITCKNSQSRANNTIDTQARLNYYNAAYLSKKIEETNQALLETDGSGRFTSVKFDNDSHTYTLNVEQITDEAAYEDAMNQYLFKKAQYEKTIADINAKTSIIQQEDRTLELRLKQLDTEQHALATEMDAVKKVIKDNVEKTFKTFSD